MSAMLGLWHDALFASPFAAHLGLRAATLDDGTVVLVLPGVDQHIGDIGRRSVHGGVLGAFVETCARVALVAHTGRPATVVSATTDFVHETPVADTFAHARLVRVGRRVANVRVDVFQDDRSRLLAIAQLTMRIGG